VEDLLRVSLIATAHPTLIVGQGFANNVATSTAETKTPQSGRTKRGRPSLDAAL